MHSFVAEECQQIAFQLKRLSRGSQASWLGQLAFWQSILVDSDAGTRAHSHALHQRRPRALGHGPLAFRLCPSFVCRRLQVLVLWLDCDREGESIAYEVIEECTASGA